MNQKIKNFFLIFSRPNKKRLILALLFFVIFGLIFSSRPALALEDVTQVPGLGCGVLDFACKVGELVLSVMIKIAVILFLGIPLLISCLFVGIMALILGWIISPDFISLKFTQNPFVDIGLSITRGFANMGFILFLVVIALATALRIEEYKAKKTLPTLIIIALLINFSPVFCGFIIDASNIVMNFFLSNITGLTGFANFFDSAFRSVWNSLVSAGFNLWANIAAAMQVLILIVFNWFAGFIFILFSLLFTMRYIMLWILVILSPIAFVSYILPVTRRGRTLLNWRTWWEQLIAWSVIGIIAGFFLYLGFTMISMINANPGMFVTQPTWAELGLMNNVLPYLIPLVLLWIAHKETKRTSAWFAREIVEAPEKVAKSAVMAGLTAATMGGAAAMTKLPTTIGKLGQRMEEYGKAHPTTIGGKVAGTLGGGITSTVEWGKRRKKGAEEWVERREKGYEEWAEKFKEEHPDIAVIAGKAKVAGEGLKKVFWDRPKEEVIKGVKEAVREFLKERGLRPPSEREDRLGDLVSTLEREERLPTGEEVRGFPTLEAMEARGESDWRVYHEEARRLRDEMRRKREKEVAPKRPRKEKPPKEIEKMEPEEFREKIRPEELKNINIFYKASPAQITVIEKRGTEDQKKALLELGRSMADEIVKKVEDLVAKGKEKEAEDLNEKFKSIERIKEEEERKTKYST